MGKLGKMLEFVRLALGNPVVRAMGLLHLYRALYWLCVNKGIWRWWSGLYRKIWQGKFVSSDTLPSLTVNEAKDNMALIAGVRDSWRTLGHAIGSPHRFAWLVDYAKKNGRSSDNPYTPDMDCDCDDFAIYGTASIPGSYYLSVSWVDSSRWTGHAVCLVPVDSGFVHVGNWGLYGPYESVRDVVESLLAGKMIGWAICDSDLKVVASGRYSMPDSGLLRK